MITPAWTWSAPAPTARSSASSRVRWVTTMAKVLKIRKIDVTIAMTPKTVSRVVRNPMLSATRPAAWSAACRPVMAPTVESGPRRSLMSAATVPGSPLARTSS